MKKTLLSNILMTVILVNTLLVISLNSSAQSGNSGPGNNNGNNNLLRNGLSFVSPSLKSGSDLQKGAVYLFEDVANGVDATLRIDSLVNGAKVVTIDDNSNGTGYKAALQPEVKSGNVIGRSYAVFTISFLKAGTNIPETLQSVNATALDIDGNLNLKEFAEMRMGTGGLASYMSNSLDISLLGLLLGKFKGENILGIERNGIDTSAFSNMFTASNSGISSFSMKYGMFTVLPTTTSRQFSLYMKGFSYPNQVTLPVELVSFSAILNSGKVDLKWITASEKNVSHFEIEKSTDGKNFTSIGMVFAYGNTSEKMNYSFTDKNVVQSGVMYYRLRSVDIDQKNQLSEVKLVRIATKNESIISILTYPNPVTNELRVTVPAKWQGQKVVYELLSNSGQVLIRNEAAASGQTENINTSRLATGYYLVKVSCNGESAQQKVIKQ